MMHYRQRTRACSECGYTHYHPQGKSGCESAARQRARRKSTKRRANASQVTARASVRVCPECGGKHSGRRCPAERPHKKRRLRRAMNTAAQRASRAAKTQADSHSSEASAVQAVPMSAEAQAEAEKQEQLLRDVDASNNPFHPNDTFLHAAARLQEFRRHRQVGDVNGACHVSGHVRIVPVDTLPLAQPALCVTTGSCQRKRVGTPCTSWRRQVCFAP